MTRQRIVRGRTARDTGLSLTQRKLLVWLLQQEEAIKASGDRNRIKELNQKGVPWSAKRFYDDAHGRAMPSGQGQSISRTLRALEDSGKKSRRLVARFDTTGGVGGKIRTSHVKLTPEGRHAAHFEREHGKTKRQQLEERKLEDMRERLEYFREAKREFQDATALENLGRGPVSVNHPWEYGFTVSSDSVAFERVYDEIIRDIYRLAVKLGLPRTPDEMEHLEYLRRLSLELPF